MDAFVHLVYKYLLHAYCVQANILGVIHIARNKTDSNPALIKIEFRWEDRDSALVNKVYAQLISAKEKSKRGKGKSAC